MTLRNYTFTHDNASARTAKHTQEWIRVNKVDVLEWLSCSPDINPIENLWEILDQRLRKGKVKPKNKDELWKILEQEWYNIGK
jgi:hypothetical protein